MVTPADKPAAVVVENLVLERGPVRAVDGVSFTVPTGAITVLLGPNGAGKTSTIEHLEGFIGRTSGSSAVLGLDPLVDRTALALRVGIMLQEGGIPTAIRPAELLAQYASFFANPADPEGLLELVGLRERARTAYRRLSGGEKQRLSLALALIGEPELLFLDEPTAGVDLEGSDLIRALISSLRDQGRSILLTTHDLAEAEQLADRVIIIDHGRLLAEGTIDELAADTHEPSLRFRAAAQLDVEGLSVEIGCTVDEVTPGQYVVGSAPTPEIVARVTAWLAARDEPLLDLRTSEPSLEDLYRRLIAEARP